MILFPDCTADESPCYPFCYPSVCVRERRTGGRDFKMSELENQKMTHRYLNARNRLQKWRWLCEFVLFILILLAASLSSPGSH